jgi:murein L,D-transpeptidase YafK
MKRQARLLAYLAVIALFGLMIAALILPRQEIDLPPPPPLTGQIDRIVIEKAARRMQLFQDGKVVRSYRIALGFTPQGDKMRQGDGRTPEGMFTIDRRNPRSAFHLSLGLDYPRPEDRARAAAGGYDPGGDIFIHGQPNALPDGFRLRGDWTAGCIAVTNAEMREIWAATPIGTPVELRP